MTSIVTQVGEIGSLFGGVAGVDPLSTLLLALGVVLTVGASAVVGLLALGAALDLVVPDRIGRVERPGTAAD